MDRFGDSRLTEAPQGHQLSRNIPSKADEYPDHVAKVIVDNPNKKVIRYSLRHGSRPKNATPEKRTIEFVNHQGYSEAKPVYRAAKPQPARMERSKSNYLNSRPVERMVKTVLPPQSTKPEGIRIMRGTQQPAFTQNGENILPSHGRLAAK